MNITTETSTQANDMDDSENIDIRKMHEVARLLWTVFSPIILIVGTFGNTMILIVLRRTSAEGAVQSVTVFFGALAVSDFLLLYMGLLRQWLLNTLSLDIRNLNSGLCKLHVFLVYFLTMSSSWFLVCMTMHRVMLVVWPHRVGVHCTRVKAKVTVLVVVVLLAALNAHLIVVYDLELATAYAAPICYDHGRLVGLVYYSARIYPWIDLLFSSAMPSLILFVGNAVLATRVVRSTRRANRMRSAQGQRAREKAASSLTVTLMSVSATFLFLTLPMCILIVVQNTDSSVSDVDLAKLRVGYTVTSLLWYSNAAVNFYVYCLTGTKFREECKRILSCCCRKAGRTNRLNLTAANGIFTVEHQFGQQVNGSMNF